MALVNFVDVGLAEPTLVALTSGAFNSFLPCLGLSLTVESGCCISPSICLLFSSLNSKLAGLAGWKADLTTSIVSSSESSPLEWSSSVELTSEQLVLISSLLEIGEGLRLLPLLVGDNLTLRASAEEASLWKLLPREPKS